MPANVITRVATLTVPAGAYSVQANMVMTAFAGETDPLEALLGANGSLGGTCTLDAGGPAHSSTGTIVVNNRQTPTTLSMQLTRTVGAPTDFIAEVLGQRAVARLGDVDHRDDGRQRHARRK